jgi:hypothetical protein
MAILTFRRTEAPLQAQCTLGMNLLVVHMTKSLQVITIRVWGGSRQLPEEMSRWHTEGMFEPNSESRCVLYGSHAHQL